VKRQRQLRKLVPDDALFRRRAAGESFRSLAPDYGVAHTTLMDYFKRPECARALRQAENQLRAERRAAADRRAAERRLEREVRSKAAEQAKGERKQARDTKAASRESASRRRRPPRNDYEAWLDERDAPIEPLARADLHSQNDDTAAIVVAEGGGIQDVIEATGLHTFENVTGLIDPAILKQALDNDVLRRTQASNSPPP
jgi:hypothetical protein